MLVTITEGKYAGSKVRLSKPCLETIHTESITVDLVVTEIKVDGVPGTEVMRELCDTCASENEFHQKREEFLVSVSEEFKDAVNEQLKTIFDDTEA